jgi:predicted DNA-binding transcriptional regulator AlpA
LDLKKKLTAKEQARRREQSRSAHRFRFYRPIRIAGLLDVDPSTIWRMVKRGILPQPVELYPGGPHGWFEPTIEQFLEGRREKERD